MNSFEKDITELTERIVKELASFQGKTNTIFAMRSYLKNFFSPTMRTFVIQAERIKDLHPEVDVNGKNEIAGRHYRALTKAFGPKKKNLERDN